MKKSKQLPTSESLLSEKGFKITPSRVEILTVLLKGKTPMTVEGILKELKSDINKTTVYRALSDFVEHKILNQTDFRDGKIYYEYQDHHHHHVVCTLCGLKEEVTICIEASMPKIKKQSKQFNEINDHILEFFGLCKKCAS